MKDKLRAYLDSMFADAPKTRRAYELQEEVMANLLDKYNDLLEQGKSEEEAYKAAIASIGDIEDIVEELHHENERPDTAEVAGARKRSAALTAIAIMLYIISPVFVILASEIWRNETIGVVGLFACCAIATGLLVFNSMTKPKYIRRDDTVVEEFKEFKSRGARKYTGFGQISAALWSLTLVAYFVVSFATFAWHITWIIFLIAVAIQNIIKAVLDYNYYKGSR